jgi:L-iditol 2-dehydrogenase
MKAMRYYAPQDIRLEEVKIPKIGPDEILVKVKAALTCGTDVKMYKRDYPLVKPPLIFGHEFAGIISDVGSNITQFKNDQRVVAASSAPCNICYFCKIGKPNLCEHLSETLIGFSLDGAYAEYIRIPAPIVKQNTYELPDHVTFEEAALLEPLACVVNGNDVANIKIGDTVVVIGAGPIGLMQIQLAKIKGATNVICIDLKDERLKIASELGADVTINSSKEDQVNRVKELTNGLGADVVIEAVGLPKTWELAVDITRKAGTTVFFGGCPPGAKITLDAQRIHYGDLTIKGIFHHTPLSVKRAYKLIIKGSFKGRPLITDKMPLSKLEQALQLMAEGKCIKIAIMPSASQ